MYRSGKIFKNVASVCYRQWRADSHCKFDHGYALTFEYEFASEKLDIRNWIFDFGGLKPLKLLLEQKFDHKTLAAEDDPHLNWYIQGANLGTVDLIIVPRLSCESFAKLGYDLALPIIKANAPWVDIVYCSAHEHEYNWGKYVNPKFDSKE
jgi:6-pyruvoyltetrahydropterin/6-carboxytetrahydropterin synthase